MEQRFLLLGAIKRLLCLAVIGLWTVNAQAGYTHYYSWHQTPDAAALKACVAEMSRVIEARKDMMAGADGEGSAVVESARVDFNGRGENSHEPFLFPGDEQFNFCKTAGKPYDEVVTACLLVARDHFSPMILEIDSDGSWQAGDWQPGAKLYASVLGRQASNPMVATTYRERVAGRPWVWLAQLLIALAVMGFWTLFFRKRRR